MTLSNILPLKDGSGLSADQMLFVYDEFQLASNQVFNFSFEVNSSIVSKKLNIKATLVWTDVPFTKDFSAEKTLVNDIDLLIMSPSMKGYWGNAVPGGDHVNPCEQALVPANEAGFYVVYLRANVFPSKQFQNVALVMTYPAGPVVAGLVLLLIVFVLSLVLSHALINLLLTIFFDFTLNTMSIRCRSIRNDIPWQNLRYHFCSDTSAC